MVKTDSKENIYANDFDGIRDRSLAAEKEKKYSEAVELCKELISIRADDAESYSRLGRMHVSMGKAAEAIEWYKKCLEYKRDWVELFNISVPYQYENKYAEAEVALKESLSLNANNYAAYMNLSTIYINLGRLEEAEEAAKKSLALSPENSSVHYKMGLICSLRKKNEESLSFLKSAISLDPGNEYALALLLTKLQNDCAWDEIKELLPKIKSSVKESIKKGVRPAFKPYAYTFLNDNPESNFAFNRIFGLHLQKSAQSQLADQKFDFSARAKDIGKDKITIGYVSFDIREHPLAFISQELFSSHNKKRFRIACYATCPDDGSEVRKKYVKDSDLFVDLYGTSDIEAARRIYNDEVDILVDLTGYTNGGRTRINALRPAPINVNMWGFPGTIGNSFMDYIIADKTVIPEEHEKFYAEKPVYLPRTLQINHDKEKISSRKFTREELRLPEDGFVFCSFNPTNKFEPVMFSTWANILNKVQDSVLWLRAAAPQAEKNIKDFMSARGVEGKRIIFASRIEDRPDYFRRLQFADLALDTRIYNGGSTTMDALWAGVPVLTLLGNHYASRMSAGIINGADMAELITSNIRDYENLAVELATGKNKLANLRKKLWDKRNTSGFFDSERYTKNLEKAFEEMVAIYKSGSPPNRIEIEEGNNG